MNTALDKLLSRFAELGIAAPTVPYPAHQTVEEGKALRGDMSGTFTKNLLLKDKKRSSLPGRGPRRWRRELEDLAHPDRCLRPARLCVGRSNA